jgi:hypothetical protein
MPPAPVMAVPVMAAPPAPAPPAAPKNRSEVEEAILALTTFACCSSLILGILSLVLRNNNNAECAVAGAILSSLGWSGVSYSSLFYRVKKSSSNCIFRLNLLCLALIMFAPLVACSISAAIVLETIPGSHDTKPSFTSSPLLLFLIVVSIAPYGLLLSMLLGCGLLMMLFTGLQAVLQTFIKLLQACINPAAFRDGAHAHDEVVVNVGGKHDCEESVSGDEHDCDENVSGDEHDCDEQGCYEHAGGNEDDCDHVLPNAITRLEDSKSGETSIPVAIAAEPGRDFLLSRVQELEREVAMLRSQRG